MSETIFVNNYQDLDDFDLEQIASQVKEGFSSGHLSNEEGKTKVYWELKVNVWKDK